MAMKWNIEMSQAFYMEVWNGYERSRELEEENKKLKSDLEQFSEAYKRYRDYEKEELAESCYDLEKENKNLKVEIRKLKEDVDFYYKSAKQFREQVEKWEKDFVEWRIVEKD